MSLSTISVDELHNLVQSNDSTEVIDVRTPAEFQEVHATCCRNVPLDSLDPNEVALQAGAGDDKPIYVICLKGGRGKMACEKFMKAGFSNVVNVEGGTLAWESAGLPVVRGKQVISLERQVRIAAGLLVLLGIVLATFVHPYFAGLSAFVGAGLVFAGITDTCGMGMLLAKMPWNQVALNNS